MVKHKTTAMQEKARQFLADGKPQQAIASLRAHLRTAPGDAGAWFQLGFAQARANEPEAAIAAYRKAVQLRNHFPEAWNNLGNALRRRRQRDEALEAYQRALAQAPGYADAAHNLAVILIELNRAGEARDVLSRLLAAHPEREEAWGLLTTASFMCGSDPGGAPINGPAVPPLAGLSALRCRAEYMMLGHDYAGVRQLVEGTLAGQGDLRCGNSLYFSVLLAAIASWLEGGRRIARENLAQIVNQIRPSTVFERNTGIFALYLLRLSEWHVRQPTLPLPLPAAPVLHVLGDSHALALAGMTVDEGQGAAATVCKFIMGCKAYHLGRREPNRYQESFAQAVRSMPADARLLLSFGEIDCRLTDGLIPAQRAGKLQDMHAAIVEQVRDYLDFVAAQTGGVGGVWVQGIPAPNLDWATIPATDRELLVAVILQYNQQLAAECVRHGMRFLNVFQLTAAADGTSNRIWHLDRHHLIPTYLSGLLRDAAII